MEEIRNLILAVEPGQLTAAGAWKLPIAHLAYRMGDGPHLFRANTPLIPTGGWMVIDDARFTQGDAPEGFCNEVLRECAARRFTGVVCRFQGRESAVLADVTARLAEVCKNRGIGCFVTEAYGAGAPDAKVIISTAISGGSLQQRLEEATARFGTRLALWVERVAEDFLLPSPSGAGAPLTVEELHRRREERGGAVFFSPELCAHYFTYMSGDKGHFVLFDDAGSIRKKLRMAESMGIGTAFLPYGSAADVLEELLKNR